MLTDLFCYFRQTMYMLCCQTDWFATIPTTEHKLKHNCMSGMIFTRHRYLESPQATFDGSSLSSYLDDFDVVTVLNKMSGAGTVFSSHTSKMWYLWKMRNCVVSLESDVRL